ncbi:MAG: YkgJ family cysteine cluster protein [Dehalococcoidales bacterium]|nr:YkgJ family cysteine cluster protein [Dehalococcoidales bacterium]
MAELTGQETIMFSKYWNKPDLYKDNLFWLDCYKYYKDQNIPLPMEDLPRNRHRLMTMLKCPPGLCGDCCRYDKVHLSQNELNYLKSDTAEEPRIGNEVDGRIYLDTKGGCQYCVNNSCAVYNHRPFTCETFPIQDPKVAYKADGGKALQMLYRLKCPPALDVIRAIIHEVCDPGLNMVLPDLTIVPVYRKEAKDAEKISN